MSASTWCTGNVELSNFSVDTFLSSSATNNYEKQQNLDPDSVSQPYSHFFVHKVRFGTCRRWNSVTLQIREQTIPQTETKVWSQLYKLVWSGSFVSSGLHTRFCRLVEFSVEPKFQ